MATGFGGSFAPSFQANASDELPAAFDLFCNSLFMN
jgi:hypothetical protein